MAKKDSTKYLIGLLSSLQSCGMNPKMEQVMTILAMNKLCLEKEDKVSIAEVHRGHKEAQEALGVSRNETVKSYLQKLLREEEN